MNTIDNTITTALNFNQPGESPMLKKLFDAWVDTLMYGLTGKAIEQVGFHRMFVDYICTAHSYTKKNDLDEGAFMPFDVFCKTVREWAGEIDGYLRDFDGDTLAADTFYRWLAVWGVPRSKDVAVQGAAMYAGYLAFCCAPGEAMEFDAFYDAVMEETED